MRDTRIALKNGTEINWSEDKKIWIKAEVGRGASCIVYDAAYLDSIDVQHDIRVKECYPSYLLIDREGHGELVPFERNEDKFELAKKNFIQSYKRNAAIRNTLGLTNSTINSTDIVHCNNTIYIIMVLDEGIDYKRYDDQSLKELFTHIRSLAELIQKYHNERYLHLDIKPENVFILPETDEHILLFDFDSVTTCEELAQSGRFRLSFSEGFSAPEQIQGKINKIGTHTDIYSIGALTFYKLFGRKAALDDCRISNVYNFGEMKYASEKYQPKLYRMLETFFRKTLSTAISPRWNNMEQLVEQLDELIKLSDVDGIYLIDTFQYNSACFVGRENELEQIGDILAGSQLVFLSGIGGIGKTELAKQYANTYRNQYDTIIFSVFEKNIESLVNDEIMINQVSRDEKEADRDYFERKIEILKKIATDKDLVIIDNFDVDSDEKLETVFSCPCKFIITTRMDFRDYNYEQIYVDRIDNLEDILSLFFTYNDTSYEKEENEAIEKLIDYIDHHTMTVELIAKYLRVSGESPIDLYNRFLEKEGTVNTENIDVKQRKDRRLRSESVNSHLETLFDISGFDDIEKEIISSLSLFAGIRMKKTKFEDICAIENVSGKLDKLIKRGWVEYNEISGKISLHQVIQDLIYKNFAPNAELCAHITAGMIEYISADTANNSERRIKNKVLDIFMDRLTGDNINYARLCLEYGKENKLSEAEKICLQKDKQEAFDILQRIYRKKIKIAGEGDDMFEAFEDGMDVDDYIAYQLGVITDLLDKVILCCRKYSEHPDYIAKEYIEAGSETDSVLADCLWLYSSEQNPDMDKVYHKIIDMYNVAAEQLPLTSYSAFEKEELYKKIQDFYSEKDLWAMYRIEHFSDIEKAYWYQKLIDQLRLEMDGETDDIKITNESGTEYLWSHDISCSAIAEKFEKEGRYEEAIKYYKKAYEDGDEVYETVMQRIAHVYLKMDEPEKAVGCLERVLDDEKEMEKNPDSYFSYSCYICIDLIKNLIKLKRIEKAREYARELIHYEEPDTVQEDNSYAVTYVLAAYYFLYTLASDETERLTLWQRCLKYYEMLGKNTIDDVIYDFVIEYLYKENEDYEVILKVLNRINTWQSKDIKEKIIQNSIKKYNGKTEFEKYQVILLLRYAELFNEYPYEDIKEAQNKLEQAQELYNKYRLNDDYVQSLIYNTKAEIMFHVDDYEYDKINEIKKKCNYKLLAEVKIREEGEDAEKSVEIWKNAAWQYSYIDNYIMEVDCLKYALEILEPILNQYEFSKFDGNYCHIMNSLIRAYIDLGDFENAMFAVKELYDRTIEFYGGIENSDDILDHMWKISKVKDIADYYVEMSQNVYAVKIYLVAIYVGLKKTFDLDMLVIGDCAEFETDNLCEMINNLLDKEIDMEIIDELIDLKDELIKYKDNYSGNMFIYESIILKISSRYQHQEIEFKK